MKVFVGSSSEVEIQVGDILGHLRHALEGSAIQLVYWRDFFNDTDPDHNTFFTWQRFSDALSDGRDKCECAIMIWSGDDRVCYRGETNNLVARDNVILETGAFLAKLGERNVFIITDRCNDFHFATDLRGISTYSYDFTKSGYYAENRQQIELIANKMKNKCRAIIVPSDGDPKAINITDSTDYKNLYPSGRRPAKHREVSI